MEVWQRELQQTGLVLASYRGPVTEGGGRPAGGLASALAEVVRGFPAVWVAADDGPPSIASRLRLSSVAIPAAERQAYYGGFANRFYWMLAHGLYRGYPIREVRRWYADGYRPANERFARTLVQALDAMGGTAPVWVHDYHLFLVPALVRQRRPRARIAFFLHVPWPNLAQWEEAAGAPLADLVRGVLGADTVGLQTVRDAARFATAVEETVPEARVVWEPLPPSLRLGDEAVAVARVRYQERWVRVAAYPISVDPQEVRARAATPRARHWYRELAAPEGVRTVVRVDRLDPAKNILAGFDAFARALQRRPDLVGRVRFLAFLVPSRESVPEYREYRRQVLGRVEELNARWPGPQGQGLVTVYLQHNREAALAGLLRADVVLVNSRADGMNLVAKELAALGGRSPALVLSRTCGVAEAFQDGALLVDPDDVEGTAQALVQALDMDPQERRHRMERLRAHVEAWTLEDWAGAQLSDLGLGQAAAALPGGAGAQLVRWKAAHR
jgi:trehalose 6-phosphate synthase